MCIETFIIYIFHCTRKTYILKKSLLLTILKPLKTLDFDLWLLLVFLQDLAGNNPA